MSETDDLGTWLKAIHQAIKEHSESVTKYQQAETSQREQQAQTELKTVVRLPIEVAEYYRSEQGDRPVKNKREKLRLILEVAGVIAALVLALVTLCTLLTFNKQLSEMQKQTNNAAIDARASRRHARQELRIAQQQAEAAQGGVDAIQGQMRQDQRAWIQMTQTKKLTYNENQPLTVNIEVLNIGRTAAQHLITEVIVEKLPIKLPPSLSFKKGVPRTIETTGVLYPYGAPMNVKGSWKRVVSGGSKNGEAESVDLSIPDIQELTLGGTYVVIYARTRYIDIFGTHHVTKFCSYDSPGRKPVPVRDCVDYNGVDNNQPN